MTPYLPLRSRCWRSRFVCRNCTRYPLRASSAFLPFLNALLGEYGDARVVVVAYAAVLALTGLLATAIWIYASHNRRLVDPDIDPELVNAFTIRALSSPVVFLLSIGVALLSPRIAIFSWIVAFMVVRFWVSRAKVWN